MLQITKKQCYNDDMSKKDRIFALCAVAAVIVIFVALAVFGKPGGEAAIDPETQVPVPEYVGKIFDTSIVHTIDVIAAQEDWDSLMENAEDKDYIACDLVIDGETYPETAIRAKGNSSMSMVDRDGKYSFKIEFDHFRDDTYYGLDKLNLNNLIMDDSCVRDYLVYRMMDEFGVDSPLVSYVFLTVNGEDFGLYLAVEGVEDSFLERNYGSIDGDLYKPDDISNHKGDDDEDFDGWPSDEMRGASSEADDAEQEELTARAETMLVATSLSATSTQTATATGEPTQDEAATGELAQDEAATGEPEKGASDEASGEASGERARPGGDGGGFGFGGAADVKLQYIDDDPASYPYIFDSAKTDVTELDQQRLIEALKKLSAKEDLENTLDLEEVLHYFVAHIFTCNNDSYTGGMVHNYYLYEENGRLSMIPWDYNLAFGGMSGASSAVNEPIDTPTSSSLESLPMISWIFDDGAYFAQYHETYRAFLAQFVDSGWIDDTIETLRTMLAPYVERDPRSFCTPEEFQSGLDQLRLFCSLRAQSIAGQLDGTIPSTTEGQRADSSALIDTSGLSSSGSFGGGRRSASGEASGEADGEASGEPEEDPTDEPVEEVSGEASAGDGSGEASAA